MSYPLPILVEFFENVVVFFWEEPMLPADNNRVEETSSEPRIEGISAVTLATRDMARSLQFYRALGFTVNYGGDDNPFASLHAGSCYLNLAVRRDEREPRGWGRVILYVSDVDAFYNRAVAVGLKPEAPPRNAEWGERYFHICDPDGHELSFAQPLVNRS